VRFGETLVGRGAVSIWMRRFGVEIGGRRSSWGEVYLHWKEVCRVCCVYERKLIIIDIICYVNVDVVMMLSSNM